MKTKKQNKVTIHLPAFNQALTEHEACIAIKISQAALDALKALQINAVAAAKPSPSEFIDPPCLQAKPDFEKLINVKLNKLTNYHKKPALKKIGFGLSLNGNISFKVLSNAKFGDFESSSQVTIDHLQAVYSHALEIGAKHIVIDESGVAQFTKKKPTRIAL